MSELSANADGAALLADSIARVQSSDETAATLKPEEDAASDSVLSKLLNVDKPLGGIDTETGVIYSGGGTAVNAADKPSQDDAAIDPDEDMLPAGEISIFQGVLAQDEPEDPAGYDYFYYSEAGTSTTLTAGEGNGDSRDTSEKGAARPAAVVEARQREAAAAAVASRAWSFPTQVVLASLVGVQGLAWVSGRFLLAAVGPGLAASLAPSALAVLGLWGAAGASSALGAQYLLQGFQLIATGGMLAPPGPYMQNYKDVAEVATWALDPQALAGWQRPAQVVPTGVRSVLARATQASIDWFQVSWLAGWLAGWLAPPCRAQMLAR
jgi:hypothetical protein